MALVVNPSSSFINPINTKTPKTSEDLVTSISFPLRKPWSRIRAKSSIQSSQKTEEKPMFLDAFTKEKKKEIHHQVIPGSQRRGSKVPVFVMLPLDTVSMGGKLNRPKALHASLMALKSAGVEGVMVDTWWGLVEKDGPLKYNWEGYVELVQMVEKLGLKIQVVMSFHQCGGNVGDSCNIPLPPWVLEEIGRNPDLVYTDKSGRRNPEYISLGCDSLPVLRGRTPIQAYSDYMRSFHERFHDYLVES